jgi:hypothetical protein
MDRVALAPDPPSSIRRSLGLVLALVATTVFLAVAFVVRVAVDLPSSSSLPQRLMPVLIAAAALCTAALTVRRLPSVAWLSTAIAATIAAEEIVVVARAAQTVVAPGSWRVLVSVSVVAAWP